MHIGILFYSDAIALVGNKPQGIMGRVVANMGFFKALWEGRGSHQITLIVTTLAEKEYLEDFLKKEGWPNFPHVVSYQKLEEFDRAKPFDLIHLLEPSLYRGFALRNRLFKRAIPITGVTHTLGHDPSLRWMLLNGVEGPAPFDCLIGTAPTALSVLKEMKQAALTRLKGEPDLRTEMIPLGIDYQVFQAVPPAKRTELQIPEEAVVFLTLGRLSYRLKTDLLPLLIAFKNVKETVGKPVVLIISGASGNENYAQNLQEAAARLGIQNDIRFLLNLTDQQKRAVYDLADVFVTLCDNTQETFGLTLLEAQASGLPVIASDWDGYRSLVKEGETGMLIPTLAMKDCSFVEQTLPLQLDSMNQMFLAQSVSTDVPSLIESMKTLAENDSLRQEWGLQAKEHALNYDWSKIVLQYFSLWQELVALVPSSDYQVTEPYVNYHQIFSSYATDLLDENLEIQIRPDGKKALKGEVEVHHYAGMDEVLSLALMAQVLRAVEKKSLKLGDVLKNLKSVASKDLISYHVMWLAKYDYLRVI